MLVTVAYQFYQATMLEKRAGDVVLPGKGWQWVVGTLIFLIGIIVIAVQSVDETNVVVRGQPGFEEAVQKTQQQPQSGYADEFQKTWRENADFMVQENDLVGLRAWAASLGVSIPDFASAATIREEIRRASNDFTIYRDKESSIRLMVILDAAWQTTR